MKKANRKPLVSVHCSAYNHERFVEECVRSVLGQTVDDLEMIVVDDGSRDGTLTVLESLAKEDHRLRVLQHAGAANRGQSASHQVALAHSSGPYLARIDSDDRWTPDKLEQQLHTLEGGAVLCYGRAQNIDGEGRVLSDLAPFGDAPHQISPDLSPFEALLVANYVPAVTAMFPRKVYEQVGGYQPVGAQDWAMWLRLATLGDPVFVDRILGDYRIHSSEQFTARMFSAGRENHEAVAVIENLRQWSGLPERLVPAVDSYRRCFQALAGLVDESVRWAELSLEQEDAARLALRFRRERKRLLRLAGPTRLLRWTGRILRAGPAFREEVGSFLRLNFRAACRERRLSGATEYGAALSALRIYLLWIAVGDRLRVLGRSM